MWLNDWIEINQTHLNLDSDFLEKKIKYML